MKQLGVFLFTPEWVASPSQDSPSGMLPVPIYKPDWRENVEQSFLSKETTQQCRDKLCLEFTTLWSSHQMSTWKSNTFINPTPSSPQVLVTNTLTKFLATVSHSVCLPCFYLCLYNPVRTKGMFSTFEINNAFITFPGCALYYSGSQWLLSSSWGTYYSHSIPASAKKVTGLLAHIALKPVSVNQG